ncbi:MAG: carbon-nitrogen hydrolase family protein [Actinomycetota bacterium]|jgi:predicted amidohydrolase|nr:carbon-nitrogen hydrolase family protein [Actinomycetota bacterium]
MKLKNDIKIAMCQMMIADDKSINLEKAEKALHKASLQGCDIAILPEMFNCPYDNKFFHEHAEEYPGQTTKMLSDAAKKEGIYIIGGSIPEKKDKNYFNASFSFDREGLLLGIHRKIHLFDINIKGKIQFSESKTFTPGKEITAFDTEFCTTGVAICYDMRFPELIRSMSLLGAKIIFVPAAFNMITGPAHWHITNRCRALDNQVYFVSVSPARNEKSKYIAYGHSMVTDPWGQTVVEADEKESIIFASISMDYIEKIREELPLLKHRRPDIYVEK